MNFKFLINLILLMNLYQIDVFCLNLQSYVTYQIRGRLGDQLVAFAHAKWLSYKYNLKLLIKPFEYYDKLMLSKIEEPFHGKVRRNFYRYICPRKGSKPDYLNRNNVLFEISYFPECKEELAVPNSYYHFDVDYKDPKFKSLLRQAISPIYQLETIKPPKDCISLAVQVRRNSGGYDFPLSFKVIEKLGYLPAGIYTDFVFPLKHPTDDYYIEQIKRASEFFEHKKIYIFIFTDDPEPRLIVEKYKEALKDYKNIIFDYRKNKNNHCLNVLEDLFSITNFDAFIRPASNLGFIASIIGDFKLVISPRSHKRIGTKIIINAIDIQTT